MKKSNLDSNLNLIILTCTTKLLMKNLLSVLIIKKTNKSCRSFPVTPLRMIFFYILQNRYYSACFSYISESILLKSEMYNVKSAKYDKNKRKCYYKQVTIKCKYMYINACIYIYVFSIKGT